MKTFALTPKELDLLEKYYRGCGVKKGPENRLRHFRTNYDPNDVFVTATTQFKDDEEELEVWELYLLHKLSP